VPCHCVLEGASRESRRARGKPPAVSCDRAAQPWVPCPCIVVATREKTLDDDVLDLGILGHWHT
jgi:hypothetical protein